MATKKKRGSARKDAKKAGDMFRGDPGAKVIGGDDEMTAALVDRDVGGEFWEPKVPGDGISGTVKSIESRNTKYGWQMVFLLDTGDAGVYTVFMNSHMEREAQAECIVPGDIIGVMYKELVPTRAGDMRLFAVVDKTQSADTLPERLAKRYEFVERERARKAGRRDNEDAPN